MNKPLFSLAALALLSSCAAYDPQEFAVAAVEQRCEDYRADIAAYDASPVQLTEAELQHLDTLTNFVRNYCGFGG